MSVIVLKRKFEAVPTPTTIMENLFGQNPTADRTAAGEVVQSIIGNLGDVVELFYLASQMKATSERHVELLHEQEDLASAVAQARVEFEAAKSAYAKEQAILAADYAKEQEVQAGKIKVLVAEIQKLEKAKAGLEDEQATRDRLNKAVVAEVAETRQGLLAAVERDIAKAKETLAGVNSSIEAAKVELAALVEKKRAFIASLK